MEPTTARRPLDGIRVLDVSTVIAAPLAAMILGDLGAEVVKIEHPRDGDPARHHGYAKDGVPLWWLMLGRNKKSVTLYLGDPEGQELFRGLAATADVIVENFRPGTMEAWGLGYEVLAADNPGLVFARVSGFGRTGPLFREPGFGTMGETMSGFAFRNGDPAGEPYLPPFGLADGVTGIATALGVLSALYERRDSGRGQQVDLSIIEPLLTILEPQLVTRDQLGVTLGRTGNQAEMNAPRGMYRTKDEAWVALSASTASTAGNVVRLMGAPGLADEPWFAHANQRRAHAADLDAVIVPWFAARTAGTAVAECRAAGVPVAPVHTAEDILADPQYAAIGAIGSYEHSQLGTVRMPDALFRLSRTPAGVRWLGPELGAHTEEVLDLDPERLARLRERGVL
ncbi:CaiB/BaiF CoA transferase family protein [Pseudonocardia halophobica]|uniref:CaiB/BaiF CoA transferase family protein n=1 Tax=Pseudonocardia halophobica TaxID=29401 RepID=UPI003D9331BD